MDAFSPSERQHGWVFSTASAVVAGLIYFLVSAAMVRLTTDGQGIATMWPGNALILALLLLKDRPAWPALLTGCALGNLAANLVTRGHIGGSAGYAAINLLEIWVAARLLHEPVRRRGILRYSASVRQFVLVTGVLAPASSALFGAAVASLFYHQPFLRAAITWFACDALGLMVFTPFFHNLFSGALAGWWRAQGHARRLEALAVLGLLASTAIGVFETSRLPVLFVLALPEMLVAFRLGWLGTQLGIVLLALIGSIMTAHGFGPISLASHDAPTRALFFQFFLATQVLLILPVVASLAASASVLNALRESEQSVQLLAEEAAVLLLGFAADGTCLKVVGNVGAMLGIGERALLGRDLGALSPINRTPLLELYAQALAQPETVLSLEFSSPLRPGRWLEANLRAPETLAGPQGSSVLVVLQDVTDRHDAQLALLRAAETDELTGLLNRAAFMSRLEAALRDERATRIHLAIFDVDRFKVINDSAGHAMGNAVLQAVAERMAGAVCAPDLLCRMGGDEFLLMLECASLAEAETRCQAVLNALHGQPIDLPTGDTLSVRVSCGLAGGGRGQSSEQMLHRADAAVYAAKRAGRNRIAAVA